MADHIQQTISDLKGRLDEHLKAARKLKIAINQLSEVLGDTPPYGDLDDGDPTASSGRERKKSLALRSDEFFNKPLSACVRTVLQMRKEADLGPATVDEIYSVMKAGGYHFEAKDPENAIRGLGVSITKNSALFARLPNGQVGLVEWYGDIKSRKPRQKSSDISDGGAVGGGVEDSSDDPDVESEEDVP